MGNSMAENWFSVKQIFPNIWGIAEFGHFEKVISYLFIGKEQALLFDTGMGIGNILQEVRLLTTLPVVVINSHCHPDHIGGNKQFKKIVQLHTSWGIQKAESGYKNAELHSFTGSDAFFISPPDTFHSRLYNVSAFEAEKMIKDSAIIEINPFTFTVISTPGHTPDSLCLYEKTSQLLLTGDTIYPGPIYLFFKESNYGDYKKSIEKLNQISDIKYLLPAHNQFLQEASIIQKINEKINFLKYKKHSNINIKIDKKTRLICNDAIEL